MRLSGELLIFHYIDIIIDIPTIAGQFKQTTIQTNKDKTNNRKQTTKQPNSKQNKAKMGGELNQQWDSI